MSIEALGRRLSTFRGRFRAAVILATAVVLFSGTAVASAMDTTDGTQLLASRTADRSNSVDLGGAIISSHAYLSLKTDIDEDEIEKVAFFVDDLLLEDEPVRVENAAPWDLGGTQKNGNAADSDFSALTNGAHTLTAAVVTEDVILLHSVEFELDKSLGNSPAPATKATKKKIKTVKVLRAGAPVTSNGDSSTGGNPSVKRAGPAAGVEKPIVNTEPEPAPKTKPQPKVEVPAPTPEPAAPKTIVKPPQPKPEVILNAPGKKTETVVTESKQKDKPKPKPSTTTSTTAKPKPGNSGSAPGQVKKQPSDPAVVFSPSFSRTPA